MPRRRMAVQWYASLTLAYSRSSVLFSLVGQSVNCVKMLSVLFRETCVKSQELRMEAPRCLDGCRVDEVTLRWPMEKSKQHQSCLRPS